MPQYEVELSRPTRIRTRQRGLDPADAVRQAADLPADAQVAVEAEADLKGWSAVTVEGEAAGRVRPHQRMRFRRD